MINNFTLVSWNCLFSQLTRKFIRKPRRKRWWKVLNLFFILIFSTSKSFDSLDVISTRIQFYYKDFYNKFMENSITSWKFQIFERKTEFSSSKFLHIFRWPSITFHITSFFIPHQYIPLEFNFIFTFANATITRPTSQSHILLFWHDKQSGKWERFKQVIWYRFYRKRRL